MLFAIFYFVWKYCLDGTKDRSMVYLLQTGICLYDACDLIKTSAWLINWCDPFLEGLHCPTDGTLTTENVDVAVKGKTKQRRGKRLI